MFKIAYCAGHHLRNPRGVSKEMGFGSIREWTLNDRVARYFAEAAGQYEGVELLRTDDPTGETLIDIPERCAAANEWGADIYIDMHHNGGANNTNAGGVVAYSRPKDANSKKYAASIYMAVIAAGGLRGNRATPLQTGTNWDTFKYSKMPAVLMEYGFMDSKKDTPVIVTEAYSKAVGYATMEGIAQVAGLKKLQKVPNADVFYRVQVGAFNEKSNAEAMCDNLRKQGYKDAFVVEVERK